jgi:protein-S-isoprenylcysteine O-methyltransferase Ste14
MNGLSGKESVVSMLKADFVRHGNWLFRWRSVLPLALYAVGVALLVEAAAFDPEEPSALDDLFEHLYLGISLFGLTIRVYVQGTVPEGTSGRNTRGQLANELNSSGAYSIVRHPLYLGNFFIYLGIVLFPEVWWLPVAYGLLFCIYYERIMFAEEEFLEGKFGESFRAWADRTPAFFPRLGLWRRAERPFSPRRAIRRDRSAFLGLGLAFGVLEFSERAAGGGADLFGWSWVVLVLASVALYITGKWILRD